MQKQTLLGDIAFLVSDLLTPAECARHIAETEAFGYGTAPVTAADGYFARPDIRNNDRVMRDDFAVAEELWERLRAFVPAERNGAKGCGLNERLRFYRYDPGERFRPHTDAAFARSDVEISQFTVLVYLNGGFAGGETVLYASDGDEGYTGDDVRIPVVPEPGLALVFAHGLLHEGAAVSKGRKYVLRTDVMYRAG